MPIPQIVRIDPRDLDKNIAIGVSIPFNGSGVFRSTYSTKDQIKSNLINLLLTYKGERIENPEFGADLPRLLFEQQTNNFEDKVKYQITSNVSLFMPEITILNINVDPGANENSVIVTIDYQLNISGQQDHIIIELQ